jgi:tryptophan 2,3-dioxygenase
MSDKKLTDYEKYIRTEELLALQKKPSELANPDELLFQSTHQAAEIWMKVVEFELARVKDLVTGGDYHRAAHHLHRSSLIWAMLRDSLGILETMPPSDYHEFRVKSLGHGSGQQSPGFNRLLALGPTLWPPFQAALTKDGLDVLALHRKRAEHYGLFQLMQGMLELDESFGSWRLAHIQMVRRIIGLDVMSLQNVPAHQLWEGAKESFFPELWAAVNVLTREYRPGY